MESGWKAILGHLASNGNECVLNNEPRIQWLFISHNGNTLYKNNQFWCLFVSTVCFAFDRVWFEFCRKNLGTSSLPKKRKRTSKYKGFLVWCYRFLQMIVNYVSTIFSREICWCFQNLEISSATNKCFPSPKSFFLLSPPLAEYVLRRQKARARSF